jgi:hypothetical protein
MSEDSEIKPTEPQGKLTGVTVKIVKTPFGGLREALIGPDGKFMKKARKPATAKDAQAILREFLETKLEKGADGKLTKRSKSRLEEQYEKMHQLIVDENPITRNAAVKAWEVMLERAYGKAGPGDKELDALKASGIRTIFIEMPTGITKGEEHVKELKPSFIDAEIIEGPKEKE